MFGMANLQPDETGLNLIVHVYKDEARYSKHGPRIKVFPGRPNQGNPTTITIPTTGADEPEVIGKATISGRDLAKAKAFVRRNWELLALHWYAPNFTDNELRAGLR